MKSYFTYRGKANYGGLGRIRTAQLVGPLPDDTSALQTVLKLQQEMKAALGTDPAEMHVGVLFAAKLIEELKQTPTHPLGDPIGEITLDDLDTSSLFGMRIRVSR